MYVLIEYLFIVLECSVIDVLSLEMDSRLQVAGEDLTIDPMMLSDDGGYTCEVSNIVGATQSTV